MISEAVRHDELLAAIYAAPADDGPRLVYADALTEQGDPRGEFIALQIERARGAVTDTQVRREWELSTGKRQISAWAGVLSQAGRCTFSRGFPDEVFISGGHVERIVGEPSMRLLRNLHGLNGAALAAENTVLASAELRGAAEVASLSVPHLDAMQVDAPWPAVGVSHRSSATIDFKRLCPVRKLSVHGNGQAVPRPLAALVHLDELNVSSRQLKLFLEGIAPIRKLFLSLDTLNGDELVLLRALPKLRELHVYDPESRRLALELFEGLTLEQLATSDTDARSVIDTMPALQRLILLSREALGSVRDYLMHPSREMGEVRFGPLNLKCPFSSAGVARLMAEPWLLKGTAREQLQAACETLTTECVQRIDVVVQRCDPRQPSNLKPAEQILALVSERTQVPVELRWQ